VRFRACVYASAVAPVVSTSFNSRIVLCSGRPAPAKRAPFYFYLTKQTATHAIGWNDKILFTPTVGTEPFGKIDQSVAGAAIWRQDRAETFFDNFAESPDEKNTATKAPAGEQVNHRDAWPSAA